MSPRIGDMWWELMGGLSLMEGIGGMWCESVVGLSHVAGIGGKWWGSVDGLSQVMGICATDSHHSLFTCNHTNQCAVRL